jgi:hypothetical protein
VALGLDIPGGQLSQSLPNHSPWNNSLHANGSATRWMGVPGISFGTMHPKKMTKIKIFIKYYRMVIKDLEKIST